jgi:endonuclease YncB( thermonuclease family)
MGSIQSPCANNCGTHVADALAERIRGHKIDRTMIDCDQFGRKVARCQVTGENLITVARNE